MVIGESPMKRWWLHIKQDDDGLHFLMVGYVLLRLKHYTKHERLNLNRIPPSQCMTIKKTPLAFTHTKVNPLKRWEWEETVVPLDRCIVLVQEVLGMYQHLVLGTKWGTRRLPSVRHQRSRAQVFIAFVGLKHKEHNVWIPIYKGFRSTLWWTWMGRKHAIYTFLFHQEISRPPCARKEYKT